MGPTPKCHFVLGLPCASPKILKIGTPTALEAHNFVCRPPIEVVALVESFKKICGMPPSHKGIRAIPNF